MQNSHLFVEIVSSIPSALDGFMLKGRLQLERGTLALESLNFRDNFQGNHL